MNFELVLSLLVRERHMSRFGAIGLLLVCLTADQSGLYSK